MKCPDQYKWRMQKEGVWKTFTAHRTWAHKNNLMAPDPITYNADDAAQFHATVRDATLQEQGKAPKGAEKDHLPAEMRTDKAELGKPQPLTAGAGAFDNTVDFLTCVEWAFNNLNHPDFRETELLPGCPSAGAHSLLAWARWSALNRAEFMKTFVARLAARDQKELEKRKADDGREFGEDRILEIRRILSGDAVSAPGSAFGIGEPGLPNPDAAVG